MEQRDKILNHGERLATLEANYKHIFEKLDDVQTDVRSIKESAKIFSSLGEMVNNYKELKQAVGLNLWIVKNKKFVIFSIILLFVFIVSQGGIDFEIIKSFIFNNKTPRL